MTENVVLDFTNPDYENIRVLNRLGGTGDLFVAHKKGMDIDVVIKRTQLQYHKFMNQEKESSILKNLRHQYLPRIYDVLYGKDGCIYTVMDLISGQNLQQYVEQNGPISQKACYRWACQLCEVVHYLHQENSEKPAVIHCDIKPGNLMITSSGDICLIDFNTSLIFRRDKAAVAATEGYAAPEQHPQSEQRTAPQVPGRSEPAGRSIGGDATVPMGAVPSGEAGPQVGATMVMDPQLSFREETMLLSPAADEPSSSAQQIDYGPITTATDIYAIGATLYFAVTGHAPEKSIGPVTPLENYHPRISRSMQTIICRAMQKQPAKRFQQARDMLRALENIDQMDRSYKSYQIRKRVVAAVLAVCFAGSAYSCYYGMAQMRSERENTYLLNLAQAEQAEQSLEYDAARELLENAIRQQPGREDAYLQLAVLLYRTGDYQGAIDQLDTALSSGSLVEKKMSASSLEKLHFIKGNCYMELQDYDKAVQELRAAARQQGTGTDTYRSLAIALANNGEIQQAQDTLDILRESGASSGDCNLVAAEIKCLQKQYKQALVLYEEVLGEVTDAQLLSHAYLSAAHAALNMADTAYAEDILERGCQVLPEGQAVLQKEMLVDIQLKQAVSDKENAEQNYQKAEQLLRELVDNGYGTISTKLNLATVLQALNQYEEAEKVLTELAEQHPLDYRFDMQRAYLLIDWQGERPAEERNYQQARHCYDAAVQKYRQAQANGVEDAQMTVLKSLIEQLYTSGWLK